MRYRRVRNAPNTKDADIILSEDTQNILDFEANYAYQAGDEITAARTSDGRVRVWQRVAAGTGGAAFDATEEALWLDLGDPKYVNDVVTGGANAALSAEQGKVLKEWVDRVRVLIGVADPAEDFGTFTGTTLSDGLDGKALFQEVEDQLELLAAVTGEYIGSAATFATLPTTNPVDGTPAENGDWSILYQDEIGTGTAQNPQYPRGIYFYDGANYSLAAKFATLLELTDAQIQDSTSTVAGMVSGQKLFDREQALKGTAANLDSADPDYEVAKSWDAKTLGEMDDWIRATDGMTLENGKKYWSTGGLTVTAPSLNDANHATDPGEESRWFRYKVVGPANAHSADILQGSFFDTYSGTVNFGWQVQVTEDSEFTSRQNTPTPLFYWVTNQILPGYIKPQFSPTLALVTFNTKYVLDDSITYTTAANRFMMPIVAFGRNRFHFVPTATGTIRFVNNGEVDFVNPTSTLHEFKNQGSTSNFFDLELPTDVGGYVEIIGFEDQWLVEIHLDEQEAEGGVPDWTANTDYAVGDRVVAPMPINADFIANDGAIANVHYIFEANTARPNTIATFDDTEADSGAWDLIGVYQINGTDDRVIDSAGIMSLDPINSLSNTARNEYIHWTVVNQPLTVRMALGPTFITKWIDYSDNNIPKTTAPNEDFVIPAGVQMWVHRVGNAVSVVFEPSEGGGGGLKRITLDPDDAVFADTTIDIDYTAYEGQQFESELFVIGERTITFNAPTLPTGADRKTLIHRVFINANTADVTVTFPAGTWRNADSADDATDIVIPAGENRTLELTTLDNDGNEYVRVLGSGGTNMPMVGGYIYSGIDVANSSFGSGAISFNSSSFNTIYDPKGLVDAGGSTITIDSPEKAGAYMMALNVTSGTSGGAVVARVNGVNRLTARGEDGADSDAAVGVIELNEGDVVTISVVSGNTTYGVSFTMSQVSRFVDETQFVAADQIVAVQDNTRIVATGFGPAGGTATTDITTFTVPEDGEYEYETNVEGFHSSVIAWNKTLQIRDAAGGGGNLILSQALTMGASGTTSIRKMASPEFGTVTLQAGVTYTTRLVHANEFTDQLSPVTLILRKVPKTVEALDTNLIPANTTEVGTPLNAGSTREYTLQWDGTKIVNTLSTEKWTTGNIEYIINHLTRHMTVLGFQNITSSGSVTWTEAFADTDYTFAHDIRESGSERGIISVNTRTATSITYTLYDNVGTGDAGSVVHFAITGRIT